MNSRFFNIWNKTDAENRVLYIVCAALAITVVILSLTCIRVSGDKTVVVLPPQVDQEFWVVGDKLSRTYLEQVSFYIADRILTVSPKNVQSGYDSILPFLTDDARGLASIKASLKEQAEVIISENVYQSFYPMKLDIDEKTNTLTVRGTLRKYVGDMYISELNSKLKFGYSVKNGRLSILSIEVE